MRARACAEEEEVARYDFLNKSVAHKYEVLECVSNVINRCKIVVITFNFNGDLHV